MRVHIPNRKSPGQRFLEKISNSLDVRSRIKSGLPSVGAGSARKAGAVAGAVAGITAASAGISSLRRRDEGARDDS